MLCYNLSHDISTERIIKDISLLLKKNIKGPEDLTKKVLFITIKEVQEIHTIPLLEHNHDS